MRKCICVFITLVLILFVYTTDSWAGEKVKFLLMGDTQWILNNDPIGQYTGYSQRYLEALENINSDPVTKDAVALLHMGDIIETGRNNDIPSSYVTARQGFDKLAMPYIINYGNNDDNTHFKNTFPLGDYNTWPSFVDNYDQYKNSVHKFEAGGVKWLVVSLRVSPDDAHQNWARNQINQHQDHNVIIICHDGTTGNRIGQLAKEYNNVVLISSGHSASDIGTFTVKDNKKAGYIKTCWHNKRLDSFLAVVEFDVANGTVSGRYYCPYEKKFGDDTSSTLWNNGRNPMDPDASNTYTHPWTWSGFDFEKAASGEDVYVVVESPADNASFDTTTGFKLSVDASHPSGFEWMRLWIKKDNAESEVYEVINGSPWEFDVYGLEAGAYSFFVRARDNDGGTTDSEEINITLSGATNIKSVPVNIVSVYPNPVCNDALSVEFGLESLSKVSLSVLDMKGSVVSQPFSTQSFQPGTYKLNLPLVNILPGSYFMQITFDGIKQTHKIIVL